MSEQNDIAVVRATEAQGGGLAELHFQPILAVIHNEIARRMDCRCAFAKIVWLSEHTPSAREVILRTRRGLVASLTYRDNSKNHWWFPLPLTSCVEMTSDLANTSSYNRSHLRHRCACY